MSDKVDLIYDMLRDHTKESTDRMTRMEVDLKEHKEGVIQNRTRIEHLERHELSNETRINKLEEPGKVLSAIKKWAGWIVLVAAAAGALGVSL